MRIQVFQGVMLVLVFASTSVLGQSQNEYTVGIDSHGNYGFALSRGNENNLFQFSYASLNMNRTFPFKNLSAEQHTFSSQVSTIGLGYFRKKPLTSSLNLYYGASINWGNSPIKSAISNKNTLSNLNMQVGVMYKLTEHISIGAEFRHSYGNFWMNNLLPAWSNSPANPSWFSTW